MAIIAAVALASASLAQPTLPVEQVFSSRAPASREPSFNTVPVVDVSPEGVVVISERQFLGRRVFAASPPEPFALLARDGQPIPALGPDVRAALRSVIDNADFSPINKFGDVAFRIALAGPGIGTFNDGAIAMFRQGTLHIVAREGDPVPGFPEIALGQPEGYGTAVFMNSRRQTLIRVPAPTASSLAYLAWSPSRGSQSIAVDGQDLPFDGSPALVQQLHPVNVEQRGNHGLRSSGGADARRTRLDDRGHAYLCADMGAGYSGLYRAELPSQCLADFTNDDFIDFFDLDAFAAAFEAGLPAADADRDGFVDFFDYDRFVTVFESGCD